MKLTAPLKYWELSPAAIEELTNGCGPAGWKGKLIPDNLLGTDISEPCRIHDFFYLIGKEEDDRLCADLNFQINMLICIEADHADDIVLTRTRRELALIYYSAVRDHGEQYFAVDKEMA